MLKTTKKMKSSAESEGPDVLASGGADEVGHADASGNETMALFTELQELLQIKPTSLVMMDQRRAVQPRTAVYQLQTPVLAPYF